MQDDPHQDREKDSPLLEREGQIHQNADQGPEAQVAPVVKFSEQKRVLVEALLPLCPFLLVDATRAAVRVPRALKDKAQLVLRIGQNTQVMGIPDLELTAEGFSATLSFHATPCPVYVPWEAVSRAWVAEPFLGPIIVWPLLNEPIPEEPTKPDRPGLRVVKDGDPS